MNFQWSPQFYEHLGEVEARIAQLSVDEISFLSESRLSHRQQKINHLVEESLPRFQETERERARAEFQSYGPLEALIADEEVTEILVNGWDNIWFEKFGRLQRWGDRFLSPQSYRLCLDKICDQCRSLVTVERPMAHGHLEGLRVQIVGSELTQDQSILSLRRHPKNPWNFERLLEVGWASRDCLSQLESWLRNQRNFLVVGPTGSGKTSILNACLQKLPQEERVLLLEDTKELCLPNKVSQRFLTRQDPQGILPEIGMTELVRQSLRMRPDRLVLGEIRGNEAKDFLMALSTGHAGSFGTIHASSAHQALIRLEMLIQLGAPNWSLSAIRKLIYLSLQGILVVERTPAGQRRLKGLYRISSLEESGFLIEEE